MKTMKALVKTARGEGFMEVKEVPIPIICQEREVLVKVKACGVCRGSDLHILHDNGSFHFEVPCIVGAESCGEVEEVGSKVSMFKPGDRVVSEVYLGGCGICEYCLSGNATYCANRPELGRTVSGAFAQYYVVNEEFLHRVPDNISWREAVLGEMAAVTTKALIQRSPVTVGSDVLLIGPGPIGLCAMQVAKASGARSVVMLGTSADKTRLDLALELGATKVYDITQQGFKEQLNADFPLGFDQVVETAGSPKSIASCFDYCKYGATIVAIGAPFEEKPIVDWQTIVIKDLKIIGSLAHDWKSWDYAMRLMESGQLNTKKLCSKTYPLEKWEEAFHETETSKEILKIAICPNGDI